MIASGMGFINNDGYTSDYLGELKLASIKMVSKSKCKSLEFPGSSFKGMSSFEFPHNKFNAQME